MACQAQRVSIMLCKLEKPVFFSPVNDTQLSFAYLLQELIVLWRMCEGIVKKMICITMDSWRSKKERANKD